MSVAGFSFQTKRPSTLAGWQKKTYNIAGAGGKNQESGHRTRKSEGVQQRGDATKPKL